MTSDAPILNDQSRGRRIGHWNLRVRYLLILVIVCSATAACVDKNHPTTRPASVRDRHDELLRDSSEYDRSEMPSVSGGGTPDFDRKAFKRDWDRFWNP